MHQFELIFRGELQEGADQQDCIEQLATRLKTDPDTIRRRFFQHCPVTVLKTDNEAKAKRVQQAFLAAGAITHFKDEESTASVIADPADPSPSEPLSTAAEVSPATTRRPWRLAVAVLVLAGAAAGLAAWYTGPLWRSYSQPQLAQLEAALASEDMLLLAQLDVQQIVDIEARFMTLADPDALPGNDQDLISDLAREGIQPREQLKNVVFAGYPGSEGLEFSAVLVGQFDPAAVKALVERRYQLDAAQSSAQRLVFSYTNEQTCERSGPLVLLIEPERILIGSEERLAALIQRLEQSAPAEIELTAWQAYRDGKLASATVFAPAELTQSTRGFTGMMLRGASEGFGTVTGAFVGATATALPPGVRLQASVSGSDGEALDNRAAIMRDELEKLTASLAGQQPETERLLRRLTVTRNGDQLGASLALDGNVAEELGSLVQAVMGQMFSINSSVAGQENTPREERLMENPAIFQPSFDPSALPAFGDIPDENFHAAWTAGPVALRVKEIGIDPRQEGRRYLLFSAQGRGLSNVGKEQGGSLVIDGVFDDQGNSLMPMPSCGQNRNQDPASLSQTMDGSYFTDGEFQHYRKHEADKRVLLSPGVSITDVTRVTGKVTVQVATRTETLTLPAPANGASIEKAGARISFGNSEGQSLSYTTSGDVARILSVRALNGNGKPLDSMSHSSFGPIMGTGKAHQYEYHGTPARIEVVIATELQPQTYPFALDSVQPFQDSRFAQGQRTLPVVTDSNRVDAALKQSLPDEAKSYENFGNPPKAVVTAGPVQLAITNLQAGGFQGIYSQWDIRTNRLAELDGNRAAGEIRLQRIVDEEGTIHTVEARGWFGLEQQGMWFNGEFRPSYPYLNGSAGPSYRDYEGGKPVRLEGEVVLQIPETLSVINAPLVLGEAIQHGPLSLQAQALSENSLQLNVASGVGRLAAIEVFDASGKPVGGSAQRWGDEEENVRMNVSLSGAPASLSLHVVDDVREERYPWTVSLDE
ncbi:hypothetical protein MWU49_13760 [Alcanivorax sp. S6407]|uniref:hypothetical protein n=1 Tax=Alcanivorax sp. S6407 TaxID=2926424 RepID=UPI001FF49867|nr:hypothetical protein [Alcanivorax sp. S6407]MCK0154781.1 hypothetical protein [Alcanivorax sp. S6407]